MSLDYEFYYNWEHAQKHNPSLMMLGTSGGYGRIRANMRDAVRLGQRDLAESYFWQLVQQAQVELREECVVDGESYNYWVEQWFKKALVDKEDTFESITPFMRRKECLSVCPNERRDPNRNLYAILGAAIWFLMVVLIAMMSKNA